MPEQGGYTSIVLHMRPPTEESLFPGLSNDEEGAVARGARLMSCGGVTH